MIECARSKTRPPFDLGVVESETPRYRRWFGAWPWTGPEFRSWEGARDLLELIGATADKGFGGLAKCGSGRWWRAGLRTCMLTSRAATLPLACCASSPTG